MTTKSLTNIPSVPSLFDDFFKPWNELFGRESSLGRISKVPAVNITEDGKSYTVSVAAPGLKKEDFKVNVEENMLTISAEKETEKEEKDERFSRREYNYTSFSRSFTLPDDVKLEAIDAKYENGILDLRLPRKEEVSRPVQTKQIAVK